MNHTDRQSDSGGDSGCVEVAPLRPEEQRCPTCNYVVYGLRQNRCPECGEWFTWEQVRRKAWGAGSDLFEHRWRDQPVVSLLRTWSQAALSPWRVWTVYDRRDPPRVGPLVVLVLLQWLVFAVGWQTAALAVHPLMNGIATLVASSTPARRGFAYFFRPGPEFLVDMAIWYLATFAALQIFFESVGHAGARWKHLLRIYAHATLFASVCMALWCVLEAVVDASLFFRATRLGARTYLRLGQGVFCVGLIVTWAHIWLGYRRYLKMPHGWAIAALSIWVGSLFVETVRMLR